MMSLRPVRRCKTKAANSSAHDDTDVKSSPTSSQDIEKMEELELKPEEQQKSLGKNRKSKIWSYFKLVVNNKYECVLCSGKLKHVGDSTANFYRHMRNKHPSVSVPSHKKKTVEKQPNKMVEYESNPLFIPLFVRQSSSRGETSVKEQGENLGEQQDSPEQQEWSKLQSKTEQQETKSKKKSSRVWSYFQLISENKYQCTLCSYKLNFIGGSNSNFHRHLRKKHSLNLLTSWGDSSEENVIIEFDEERGNEAAFVIEEREENECPMETTIAKHDDTSYDANQPWRFFDIQTGSAKCRLCFRSLIYTSIADLAVLVDHLKSKHCISFRNYDSVDSQLIDIVGSDDSSGSSNTASPHGRKFEMYYTNIGEQSSTCKMCLSSVSSHRKTLISHLYREHKNFFSKKYPSFWHFSKFFSSDSFKTISPKENSSSNSSNQECNKDERFSTEEEVDIAISPKHMSYSDNIVGNFLNLDGTKAKCMFCAKSFSFSGDISILEQHILNDHKIDFIQKILCEMVFTGTNFNSSGKATNKRPIDKSPSEQRNMLNKDLLSYFEPLENLHYKCKICSEIMSLKDDESFDLLAVHVWYAHMSKIFRSIVFLQSFGISGMNQEERNSNDGNSFALRRKAKLRKARLDSITWVKPEGKFSKTWKYFLTPSSKLPYAKCRLCDHVISFKSANISNLSRHLNQKHTDVLRSSLNMFYENRRMFCRNSKRQIVKKYVMKELRKSFQCRFCSAHFSEWKSFCKHIRFSHEDHDFKKEIRFAKTLFSNRICARKVSSPTKSSSVKCKLCGEYLLHSDRETCKKHMNEKHNLAFITGATYDKYKDCEMNIVSMNDEIALNDDSHVNTFFVRSGSSYAKCKVCRKFISKNIYCRHRIPSIYSLSFGVKSVEKSENSVGEKSVPKKISSPIYCSSLNIVKNYCDICLKDPMSSICRCIVNRRFVPSAIRQNENVLSTVYLQDISKSERQVYAVLFSLNYFEKSCCLLCSEKISQSSKLLACFDHFLLNHRTLVKNWKRMSKTAERRRLMDNIEYKTYFDDSLFGWMNADRQRPVESNAISEQPAMILNNQDAPESENPVLCYEIADANATSSFNFACENATSSFNISSANPTSSLDFNNENPSSNIIVISDIKTIGNATSSQDVDTETHSSVLAITGSENQGVNVAGEVEAIPHYEERYGERRRRTSVLWSFFTRIGPKVASCNACGRVSQTSSLANLSRHLKNKHPKLAELLKQKRIKQTLSESDKDNGVPVFNKWTYFNKLTNEWAECKKCKRYISTRAGSTGNLLRHFKSKNCINNELVCHSKKESRKSASSVWQYFKKLSSDKAVCNTCEHMISIKNSNTSNLARHLRTVHGVYIFPSSTFNIEVSDIQIASDNSTPPVQYKYVVDEQLNISQVTNNVVGEQLNISQVTNNVIGEVLNISQVTNNDSFANNEGGNTGENFQLEETIPSYIAEEVVDVNPVPVVQNDTIDHEAPETISLDTLLNKIYRSPSWKYFTKLVNARVRCNLCERTLAFKSSKCINNLTRHLKKKHASEIASTHPEPGAGDEKFVAFVDETSEAEPPTKKANKRARTSYLWNYFTRSDHLKIVTCNICKIDLSFKSCPNSNLRRHLEVKHSNVLKDIKTKPLSSM